LTATPFFYMLFLFCGLASATFAAGVHRKSGVAVFAVAFALSAWLLGDRLLDPMFVGTLVGALSLIILVRPRYAVLNPILAGTLAGILSCAMRAQEIPVWISITAALAIPSIAMWLAIRDPAFAAPQIQEEALLLIGITGLIIGAAPGIADGWNSAGGMNIVDNKVVPPDIPVWVLTVGAASAVGGGLFAVWRRG
jgi:hypothetical protein